MWLSSAQQILFPPNWFLVKYKFQFQILRFPGQNHLALLKDMFFFKENAFKKNKHPSPFLSKTIGSNNCFTLLKTISGFQDTLVWIQCNIRFGLWQNASSCDALNLLNIAGWKTIKYIRFTHEEQFKTCPTAYPLKTITISYIRIILYTFV